MIDPYPTGPSVPAVSVLRMRVWKIDDDASATMTHGVDAIGKKKGRRGKATLSVLHEGGVSNALDCAGKGRGATAQPECH
jgi:hypothetical protein